MLQRIQTILFIIVVALAIMFLLLPLGTMKIDDATIHITLLNTDSELGSINQGYAAWYHVVLSFIPLLAILFTVYLISQYKRRLYQIRLGKVNIMIHLVILVISFFFLDEIKSAFPQMTFTYGPAIFSPLISLILILTANRSILKDEKLVRAADRIR